MPQPTFPTNRLKFLREERKLTQAEVAKIIDLTHTAVSRHETSNRGLTLELVDAYARLYKVSSAEIFVELPKAEAEAESDAT